MLIAFRQRLGRIKEKLERRMVKIAAEGGRREQKPISKDDRDFMLEWITGKASDAALIERAKAGPGLALIERACASRPGNALVWAARAGYCLDEGELTEALDHAERAYTLGRLEPQAGLILVRALAAAGRGEDALKIIPAALVNATRLRAHSERFELCAQWQALLPDALEPRLEAARARVGAGELEKSVEEFRALIGRFGKRAEILLPLAAVYQDLLRSEEAFKTSLEALEAEPANVDALCMAGHCARDLGNTAQADRLLSKAHGLDPASPFVQWNLGLVRMEQKRLDEAAALILGARNSIRGEPWTAGTLQARLASPAARDIGSPDWATAHFKLKHDIEQMDYLRSKNRLGPEFDPVVAEYRRAVFDKHLPAPIFDMVALPPERYPLLTATYKMPIHAPDPEPPLGPLANSGLAWDKVEDRYLAAEPHHAVIDDLLSPRALAALRAWCLESTIWNDLKGGFLGASMADGFAGRLLLGIAEDLRAKLPRVLLDRPLQAMRASSYDSLFTGIGLHADAGAVSINFWVTPDSANLDAGSGGLLLYGARAPERRSDERFVARDEDIRAHLSSVNAKAVKVPYRANRAVLFDSSLLHESDAFEFAEGYENRRINITFVYGAPAA